MPANTQCAANIRFTTTACKKRPHKNPVTNHFRSPAQKRNPVTGHLHATGPLQRQNASRDFRIFPTCRRQDGHIVRQIRCFLSPFFAIRGNASGNDRPAIRRPVTLRDDARPFPSPRHSADDTVSPPFLSKNADKRSDRRQDFSSPFWHLSFHMFYTTIFFVVFLIGTKNEKTHHRVSRPAVVCLFPPSPSSWRRPGRQWRHAQSGRPRTGSRRRTPLKPELAPDPPYPLKQDTGGGIPVPLERVTTVTTYRTCNHDRIADTFQKTIAPSPDNRL